MLNEPNTNEADIPPPEEQLPYPSHEELIKQLTEAEQKIAEHWDRILRMQADAENAARRYERTIADTRKFAQERFATELLPGIDSLELCLSNAPTQTDEASASLLEGVRLTLKQLLAALEKCGVVAVDPLNQAFNPDFHQAIATEVDVSVPPNTVIKVLQKGYTLNQRLLRPALVIVAKNAD